MSNLWNDARYALRTFGKAPLFTAVAIVSLGTDMILMNTGAMKMPFDSNPSWFVAVVFAPLLGVLILTPPRTSQTGNPGRVLRWYQNFLTAALRAKWLASFPKEPEEPATQGRGRGRRA